MSSKNHPKAQKPTDTKAVTPSAVSSAPTKVGRVNAIPEIPILIWGTGCNFTAFKLALAIYCLRIFAQLGTLIKSGEYYVEPKLPSFDSEDIPDTQKSIAEKQYLSSWAAREAREAKMMSQRHSMYAVIKGQLSTSSLEEVQRVSDWQDIDDQCDPLRLWTAIKDAHLVRKSGINAIDQHTVQAQWSSLKQSTTESVSSYVNRFNQVLLAFENVLLPPPAPDSQALHFIQNLDNNRFAEFKSLTLNHARLGILKLPSDLNAALERVQQHTYSFREVKQAGSKGEGVFATQADKKHDNKDKKHDSKFGG